ncbi:response regulator, partial [Alteromonadaceae bacterium A_SAG2]|nr:response regulator [Alteromonadaceae bacterium A_SAG2]
DTAAFGLNLLQCMIESDTGVYRKFNVRQLLDKIMSLPLNDVNKARLEQLTLSAQEQAL